VTTSIHAQGAVGATPKSANKTGKASSLTNSNTTIQLQDVKSEPRIDSRLLAEQLGNQHGDMLRNLILKYQSDFEEFGVLPFKNGKPRGGEKGGRPERFALLNEDQAYLLLAYSRNTPRVRRLKIELVKAFKRFRDAQQAGQDYLPFYHSLHDTTALLTQRAHELGSTTAQGIFHSNINKLVNKAFAVPSGSRSSLSSSMRLKVTHAQMLASDAMERCLQDGLDHKETYKRVKNLVFSLAEAGMIREQRSLAL